MIFRLKSVPYALVKAFCDLRENGNFGAIFARPQKIGESAPYMQVSLSLDYFRWRGSQGYARYKSQFCLFLRAIFKTKSVP